MPLDLQKPEPRATERQRKLAAKKRQQAAVYRVVTTRDGRRCRACGGVADPAALDMTKHGHRHHIQFRSKGGDDLTSNLILVCGACHGEIHAHRLSVSGNADGCVTFTRDGREWTS